MNFPHVTGHEVLTTSFIVSCSIGFRSFSALFLPLHLMRSFSRSLALFERAARVIPGGITGHCHPAATIPLDSPYYAVRSEGCRYWDADGNSYLDFLCGYGPNVLGAHHPEVEEAADRQRAQGDCFNHPTPVVIDLAERLVSLVDFAAWAVFGKNGSDMTTWALQVAREHTGRKKILMVNGAYHGSPRLVYARPRRAHRGRLHAHPRFPVERSGSF